MKSLEIPYPVVLASASPRRKELLTKLIAEFKIVPANLDEDALGDPDPWITGQKLAREKCLAVADEHPEALVIGSDTVVAIQEGGAWVQLSKPVDAVDAVRMLSLLSGRTHTVITGVALRWPAGMSAFTESSQVTFRPIAAAEMDAYVATGEPFDKAGGYGLQGSAKAFIERVEGSIDNVIGLPTERLREALQWVSQKS